MRDLPPPGAEAQDLSQRAVGYRYGNDGVYLAHVLHLDWRDLPGRPRHRAHQRVWLVAAADREGRHRTRLLVVGRDWRPRCLARVNMISQPVVYAGGGKGALTSDLFLWWFRNEFAPTALALHPDGASLVVRRADYVPSSEEDRVTADGLVKLTVVEEDEVDSSLVADELRLRLAAFLLSSALIDVDDDGVDAYLRKYTLKEAFADLHRAWLAIRPLTFAKCWKKRHRESEDDLPVEELQRLCLEAGLGELDERDLRNWLDEATEEDEFLEKEEAGDEDEEPPDAPEVVKLLSRVLQWMEAEPLDPGFLLAARAMRSTASLVSGAYRSLEKGGC